MFHTAWCFALLPWNVTDTLCPSMQYWRNIKNAICSSGESRITFSITGQSVHTVLHHCIFTVWLIFRDLKVKKLRIQLWAQEIQQWLALGKKTWTHMHLSQCFNKNSYQQQGSSCLTRTKTYFMQLLSLSRLAAWCCLTWFNIVNI